MSLNVSFPIDANRMGLLCLGDFVGAKGHHTLDEFLSGSFRFFVGAKSVWIVAHHTLADFSS